MIGEPGQKLSLAVLADFSFFMIREGFPGREGGLTLFGLPMISGVKILIMASYRLSASHVSPDFLLTFPLDRETTNRRPAWIHEIPYFGDPFGYR